MKRMFFQIRVLIFFLLAVSCQKTEMNEIEELMRQSAGIAYPVTEEHISDLPVPLQNYLKNVGVVGGHYYNNVKFTYKGNFKQSENASWGSMDAVTYITFKAMSRNWIGEINSSMGKLIGNDYYYNGYGKLDIRLFPAIPFMFSDGYEVTISELLTVLAEIVYNPSACLDNQIEWQQVTDYSAKATLTDSGLRVSGIFYFDQNFYITRFETNERFFGDTGIIYPWVVFMQDYKVFDGVEVPSRFKGIWQKPEGEFEYINGVIDDLNFNVNGL